MAEGDAVTAAPGFNIPDPQGIPSLKGKVSDGEWRARVELAAAYRLFALFGWDDLVFTHLSARCDDESGEERFLINPYGVLFEEMTASCLIKINVEGDAVEETPYFTNQAGFVIHSAIHMAQEKWRWVFHLHTPYGVAVSTQKDGLKSLTQFAMVLDGDVAYHDYEGIALETGERERLVADMDGKGVMILRNHGTLTAGETCAVAFLRMYFLEQACKAQILSQSGGTEMIECERDMAERVAGQGAPAFNPELGGALVWPGLLRRLERSLPGYDH